MIEDLLDTSRAVGGRLTIDRRLVDLVSVCRAVLDLLRPIAAAKSVDLKLDVSRRIPGTHGVRLNLECGMRLKDSVRASVEVRQ